MCEVKFIGGNAQVEASLWYMGPHPLAIQQGDPITLGEGAVPVLLR